MVMLALALFSNDTAWGKPVAGVQAGIRRESAETVREGDGINFRAVLRNASRRPLTVTVNDYDYGDDYSGADRKGRSLTLDFGNPTLRFAKERVLRLKPGEARPVGIKGYLIRHKELPTPELAVPQFVATPGRFAVRCRVEVYRASGERGKPIWVESGTVGFAFR